MIIRQENKNDFPFIHTFVKTAFETAEVKDGNEQDFVNKLRLGDKYIPELSLVAEVNGQIIGHVMFSKTAVINGEDSKQKHFEALVLGPVSVEVSKRNKKVGTSLIEEGLHIAKGLGYKAVFLAGNPKFYRRFGFVPSINFNIKCNIDIPPEMYPNIMALELSPNALKDVKGVVDLCGGN